MVPSNKIQLNIVNYNTTVKPAKRGSTAEVKLIGDLPSTETALEWRDSNGNVLRSCKNLQGTSPAELGDCRYFKVPNDAPAGTFYYAVLTTGGNIVGAGSFVVLVDNPVWNDCIVAPSQDAVTLKNIGGTDNNPELNDVVVYKNGNKEDVLDPNSYTVSYADEAKGDLSFTPHFDPQDGDSYTIEVYHTVTKKDANGNPVEVPGTDPANPEYETKHELVDDVTVFYQGMNEQFAPEYDPYFYAFPKPSDTDKRWGASDAIAPKFTDQDGNAIENLRDVPLKKNGNRVEAFALDVEELATTHWTTPEGGGQVPGSGVAV